ncbi:MAG: ATP-binding cassette domain-containing protein [Ectothiorhodospiraceae bacterium]|jgi:ABC-type multidrug transport system fused ATPase/permease subunit|nr:ATP-binding cassette domain-containing protein [Ectothiorhodospiraceae bacterium]
MSRTDTQHDATERGNGDGPARNMSLWRKFSVLLTPRERRQGIWVLALMALTALIETAGVATFMPFFAVLGNPERIAASPLLAGIYDGLGFSSERRFLFAMGGGVFVLIVLGSISKLLTSYVQARYAYRRIHSIGLRLLAAYLHQPYTFFLSRHSAQLGKNILDETSHFADFVLVPLGQLLANAMLVILIVALLLIVDPVTAIAAASFLSVAYALTYLAIRPMLDRIGRERVNFNTQRFTSASEAIGGIKEIKLLGVADDYLRRFARPSLQYADLRTLLQLTGVSPKFVLEGVAFGGMLLLIGVLHVRHSDLGAVLPVVGLYALAGYRLLPAMQQIYYAFTGLRFGGAVIDALVNDLSAHEVVTSDRDGTLRDDMPPAKERIRLEGVTYRYAGAAQPALRDIDVEIPVNTTVAFVGGTGAGKTTLVDILLGLLRPTTGQLQVDGRTIGDDEVTHWQRHIGYVPQTIFLADDSIAQNIALGIAPEHIDMAAVERAARVANIHDFIVQELPDGYRTTVGERGVRLSGGQRQRIGIARALYRDPEVLVLDEATSAVDNLTEQAIMDALENLAHCKTIILIAHRLSTVQHCDRIWLLERGRVIADGTYESLLETSMQFRRLARVA